MNKLKSYRVRITPEFYGEKDSAQLSVVVAAERVDVLPGGHHLFFYIGEDMVASFARWSHFVQESAN
jgi:hypothetical protein